MADRPGAYLGVKGWLLWNGPTRFVMWRWRASERERARLKQELRGLAFEREVGAKPWENRLASELLFRVGFGVGAATGAALASVVGWAWSMALGGVAVVLVAFVLYEVGLRRHER